MAWITLPTSPLRDPHAQHTVDPCPRSRSGRRAAIPSASRHRGSRGPGTVSPRRSALTEMAAWRAMRGITHLCVNTMGLGLPGPEEHVRTLERFKSELLD